MAEISRFFNSIDHDRQYSAADWAAYFSAFIGNGVMPQPSDQLVVTTGDGEGLSVSVAPGFAFINGYTYQNDGDLTLTLDTASGTYPRIDRIVVRYSRAQREMYVTNLTGTPAATPSAPALTRTADVYELCLADVLVARGASAISQANITDTRGDGTVCGFCSWLFDEAGLNYDDFWLQFHAAFADFLDSLDQQVDPDTLAGLVTRMADLTPVDLSLTLAAAGWTYDGTNAVYTQTLTPTGVTLANTTKAEADLNMANATASTADSLQSDWSLVGRVYLDANGIHFVCYGDAPLSDVPVIVRITQKR